jgi:hypothetical protein
MTLNLNLGRADQIVRGIGGAGCVLVAGLGGVDGIWKAVAVTIGSVAVFTASAGFCPLYQLLGVDTKR